MEERVGERRHFFEPPLSLDLSPLVPRGARESFACGKFPEENKVFSDSSTDF
jgi:hypothetical protein